MKKNDYFIDVASYQPSDLTVICNAAGTDKTIIKVSEHTTYLNPKKDAQADSSTPIGYYHYATFGGNVHQAKAEADFFLKNLPNKRVKYLVCDYEDYASNSKENNTKAVIKFMDEIAQAGYTPLYYSYKPYTLTNVNYKDIIKKYPDSLWIAAYYDYHVRPTPVGIWEVFPTMEGVRFWQFTSTALSGGLDKNIVLLDDYTHQAPQPQHQKGTNQKVYTIDELKFVNGLWQVRTNELVPTAFNWTENGIACSDIIMTDKNGNRIANQTAHNGGYYVINQTLVTDTGVGAYGDGGYYWRMFNLLGSGKIWLSAWGVDHLLYG